METGNPVRVIRGYKLRSQFAPEEGYRYDGKCPVFFGPGGGGGGLLYIVMSLI